MLNLGIFRNYAIEYFFYFFCKIKKMSYYNDYTNSTVNSSPCTYGTLATYNGGCSISSNPCLGGRVIVPSFGGPPGYQTGYCNAFSQKKCNNDLCDLSPYGYQLLRNAYAGACSGSCNSQFVSKLCQ
jgi:hypothetical protein